MLRRSLSRLACVAAARALRRARRAVAPGLDLDGVRRDGERRRRARSAAPSSIERARPASAQRRHGAGGSDAAPAPCTGPHGLRRPRPCTTDACDDGACVHPARRRRRRLRHRSLRGGDDCNDFNPNVHPGHPEDCNDAADNDCNGVADCFDPACETCPTAAACRARAARTATTARTTTATRSSTATTPTASARPRAAARRQRGRPVRQRLRRRLRRRASTATTATASPTPSASARRSPRTAATARTTTAICSIDCADPDCDGHLPLRVPAAGRRPRTATTTSTTTATSWSTAPTPTASSRRRARSARPRSATTAWTTTATTRSTAPTRPASSRRTAQPAPEICNNGLDDDNDTLHRLPAIRTAPTTRSACIEQANCLSPKLIPGSGTYTGDTTGHVERDQGLCGGDAGEAVFYFVLTEPSRVHLDSIGTELRLDALRAHRRVQHAARRSAATTTAAAAGCCGRRQLAASRILYPGTYYVFLDGYTVDPGRRRRTRGRSCSTWRSSPNPPEICDDGFDNDGDVYVDCADPDCTNVGACATCLQRRPRRGRSSASSPAPTGSTTTATAPATAATTTAAPATTTSPSAATATTRTATASSTTSTAAAPSTPTAPRARSATRTRVRVRHPLRQVLRRRVPVRRRRARTATPTTQQCEF